MHTSFVILNVLSTSLSLVVGIRDEGIDVGVDDLRSEHQLMQMTNEIGRVRSYKGDGSGVGTGVKANLAHAALGTVVTGVLDTVSKIPGGKQIADAGRHFTCMFGMGCQGDDPISNGDVIEAVESSARLVINEVGMMVEEVQDNIQDVKDTVLQVKQQLSSEVKSMGDRLTQQMKSGFQSAITTVRDESKKVLNQVAAVHYEVSAMKAELKSLLHLQHFQNKVTACAGFAAAIEQRYENWHERLEEANVKLEDTVRASSDDRKALLLRDAHNVVQHFMTSQNQQEGPAEEDRSALRSCLLEGGDVFSRLAKSVNSDNSLSMGTKLQKLDAVFGMYLGVFAKADAFLAARYMHTQVYERSVPSLGVVLKSISKLELSLVPLFKAFYDAQHTMPDPCPVCNLRQFTYWPEDSGFIENDGLDRPGQGCKDVEELANSYNRIKEYWSRYNPSITRFAVTFSWRGRFYEESKTFCSIYKEWVTMKCNWSGMKKLHYTNPEIILKSSVCSR